MTVSARCGSFDLSIVLTVHDDAIDLWRTLRSTDEAARYARHLGTRVELVTVLDRPTPEVVELIDRFDPSGFDAVHRVVVDHGSPGPARNAGVRASSGTFVAICDGDDLISFNGFAAAMESIRNAPERTVVVPEYVFVFGDHHSVSRYSPSGPKTALQMVSSHQYTARIVGARELLLEIPNADVPLGPGYAYEDWHLNCELLAAGANFAVATDSILFYRRRARGQSSGSWQISTRQTPASTLFDPRTFLRCTASTPPDFVEEGDSGVPLSEPGEQRSKFLRSALCAELVRAANQIDPGIRISRFEGMPWVNLVDAPARAGVAYRRLCEAAVIDGARFTDVVLASAEAGAGGARHVCGVIRHLARREPGARALVLAEGTEGLVPWHDQLPSGSLGLALRALQEDITEEEMDTIALKAIQATAAGARIHLGRSTFAARFWQRFGLLLPECRGVLHRFGADRETIAGRDYAVDDDVDLISNCLETIDAVVAVSDYVRDVDRRCFGTGDDKWYVLDGTGEIAPATRSISDLERSLDGDRC